MLKQRVITALCIVAILFAALLTLSAKNFCLFIGVVVCYGGWEWSNLAGFSGKISRLGYTGLVGVFLWGVAALLGLFDLEINRDVAFYIVLSGFFWWLIALSLIASYPQTALLWKSSVTQGVMGLFVLIPAWVAVVVLMKTEAGAWLLLAVIAIVALADIGAYFSGRAFGKHKLAINVSPGKTLEGVAGGLLANTIFAVALGLFLELQGLQWLWLACLVLATAVASVVGDLLESMVKRNRGVKDSGTILPGHGGVLDRIDSLTAALPVFVFVLLLNSEIPSL